MSSDAPTPGSPGVCDGRSDGEAITTTTGSAGAFAISRVVQPVMVAGFSSSSSGGANTRSWCAGSMCINSSTWLRETSCSELTTTTTRLAAVAGRVAVAGQVAVAGEVAVIDVFALLDQPADQTRDIATARPADPTGIARGPSSTIASARRMRSASVVALTATI